MDLTIRTSKPLFLFNQIYQFLGKIIKYFNECLELRKKAFKEDHFDIASIHHNFGLFNLSRNEEDAAKEKFNKVLKIYENLYKDYDPFSAEFCSQIAKTLFEKKKFKSSVEFYNKSIDFRKKIKFNNSVAFFSKLKDDELKAKEKSNKSEMV